MGVMLSRPGATGGASHDAVLTAAIPTVRAAEGVVVVDHPVSNGGEEGDDKVIETHFGS